jgi:phospholipid transport system substrate-binding protein
MMHRRRFLTAGLLIGLTLTGWSAPSRAQSADDAGAFVSKLADHAITTMAGNHISDTERMERFRQLFVSAFDLPEIGRFVLGRYWRAATPEQQQEFLKAFEEISVLTWAKRFRDYNGETLEVLNVAKDGEKGTFVDSKINRPTAPAIPVTWRLRQPDGGYKIVDIVVEGVSMAITHRSEYSSVMQASGGQMDGLLAAMRKKIAVLKETNGGKK